MNDQIISTYVVIFNLDTNQYLKSYGNSKIELTKDWKEAIKYESNPIQSAEQIAIINIRFMGLCKINKEYKYWCTRTFYKI